MTILPISCALRADKDPLYAPETSFRIDFIKCYDFWYFAYNSMTILKMKYYTEIVLRNNEWQFVLNVLYYKNKNHTKSIANVY
jgi:hypothetical protein